MLGKKKVLIKKKGLLLQKAASECWSAPSLLCAEPPPQSCPSGDSGQQKERGTGCDALNDVLSAEGQRERNDWFEQQVWI